LKRKCAITGASGYLGSRVAAWMRAQGWQTVLLTSRPEVPIGPECVRYSLEGGVEPVALRGVDVLIHCAYDFGPAKRAEIERVNVEGSLRLFRTAGEAGVKRIIHVSSISAFPGCQSLYGRAKLRIEDELRKLNGISIRPGLIYGAEAGGMLGALKGAVAALPIVPLIGRGNWPMYLAHEEDVCRLIEAIASHEGPLPDEPVTAASRRALMFKDILRDLGRAQGRNVVFLPIPWRLVWFGLRFFEVLGVRLRFRSDSLIGMVRGNPAPVFAPEFPFNLPFRDFTADLLR
jgi:nucleoside-diphosphate-sugar epimerase